MRRALCVGIDEYGFGPLNGCVNDAERMQAVLSKHQDGSPNFDCKTLIAPLGKRDVVTRASLREAGPFSGAMIRSSSKDRYTNWFDSFRITERVYSAGVCPGTPLMATAATTRSAATTPARARHGEGRTNGTRSTAIAMSPVLGRSVTASP